MLTWGYGKLIKSYFNNEKAPEMSCLLTLGFNPRAPHPFSFFLPLTWFLYLFSNQCSLYFSSPSIPSFRKLLFSCPCWPLFLSSFIFSLHLSGTCCLPPSVTAWCVIVTPEISKICLIYKCLSCSGDVSFIFIYIYMLTLVDDNPLRTRDTHMKVHGSCQDVINKQT